MRGSGCAAAEGGPRWARDAARSDARGVRVVRAYEPVHRLATGPRGPEGIVLCCHDHAVHHASMSRGFAQHSLRLHAGARGARHRRGGGLAGRPAGASVALPDAQRATGRPTA